MEAVVFCLSICGTPLMVHRVIVRCMHVQAECSKEVEATACDCDDIISGAECKIIPDSYNNVNATTDRRAVSPADSCSPLAVIDEIQELSGEKPSSMHDDDVTCQTELEAVTTDGGGRGVDQNDTRSTASSITAQTVVDSDVPAAAASTANSETSHIQDDDSESSNTEPNHDMAERDPEADEMAAGDSPRALVEEIGGSVSVPPVQSEQASTNDQPSRPDTILSWSDSTHDDVTSKTKCSIQFENSVIFDLDVE